MSEIAEVTRRLAEMPSERRQLFAEMLKSRLAGTRPAVPAPPDPTGTKEGYRRFYNEVTAQLNANVFGQFSFFLNYGYKPDGQSEYAAVSLPDHYINKNSAKLVLEVIGDCPVDGKNVLDVGCGRGGTVHVFQTFFKPASIKGLDLSPAAVEFDRKAHKRADTAFYEGDAENLPFADGSFEIVTNLESSHSYPNINRFYSEVHRVLAPGGHFLYTDLHPLERKSFCLGFLQHIGFELLRDRDITRNVLLSCDEIAATRVNAFKEKHAPGAIDVNNFLATPGSDVYRKMADGEWTYFILKLRKG
jgi:SAM-dependent methyltransferase